MCNSNSGIGTGIEIKGFSGPRESKSELNLGLNHMMELETSSSWKNIVKLWSDTLYIHRWNWNRKWRALVRDRNWLSSRVRGIVQDHRSIVPRMEIEPILVRTSFGSLEYADAIIVITGQINHYLDYHIDCCWITSTVIHVSKVKVHDRAWHLHTKAWKCSFPMKGSFHSKLHRKSAHACTLYYGICCLC